MFARTHLQKLLAAIGVVLVCYAQLGLLGCVSAELPTPSQAPQAESVDSGDEEGGRFQLFSRERGDDKSGGNRAVNNQDNRGDNSVRETIGDIANTVTQYTAPTGVFWTAAREHISAPTYQQLIALTAGVCIAALCAVAASSVLG